MARYEILGLEAGRALIGALARRLAENNAEAHRMRRDLSRSVAGEPPRRGGSLAALRRSLLVGAGLDVTREEITGRDAGL